MAATSIDAGSLAHRTTEADPSLADPRRAAATRFTTVADLDRSMREEAARQAVRDTSIKAVVGVVLVAIVVIMAYVVTRPVSADTLHARIMAIADNPSADLRDAKRSIDTFLERFRDDARADQIRELAHSLDLDALERRARRRLPKSQVPSAIERDYRAAMARESESPLACGAALEAILALHQREPAAAQPASGDDASLWLALVRRQIERLAPLAASERKEDAARAAATLKEAAALAAQARILAETDRETVLARRHKLLKGLVEMYADRPHVASAVTEARRLLAAP